MKRVVLLSWLVLPVFANAATPSDSWYYLSAGASLLRASFNNTYTDQTDVIPQNIAEMSEQHSYTGTVSGGYRHPFSKPWYLGADLSASIDGHYATFKSGASSTAFSDQMQIKNHFDLTAVPGLQISDTVNMWLKLGLSYASLEDSVNSPAGYTPVSETTHTNKGIWGFAAGLGIENWLSGHTALFAALGYHDYGTVTLSQFQNFSATYTHSTHIYMSDVTVGVMYRL